MSGIRDQLPIYKDSPVISMTETKTSSTTVEKNVDFLVTQGNNYEVHRVVMDLNTATPDSTLELKTITQIVDNGKLTNVVKKDQSSPET